MRSLMKCWLTFERNLKKTCPVTHRLKNISSINDDFKQLHNACASKILPSSTDNAEELSDKNHCSQSSDSRNGHQNEAADEESPADEQIESMVRQEMGVKLAQFLERTLSKQVSANIEYLLRGKEKPDRISLNTTVEKVCGLYIRKISDACASVQMVPGDDQELIPSEPFAVGYLPIRSYDEFMEFQQKLKDPGFRNSYIRYLRGLRMGTAKETTYKMIGVSIADSIPCMYNGQGKGISPKLAFIDTYLCKIILGEVAIMFPWIDSWVLKKYMSRKMYQAGINTRYRKKAIYADAMVQLEAIREETLDEAKDDEEEEDDYGKR